MSLKGGYYKYPVVCSVTRNRWVISRMFAGVLWCSHHYTDLRPYVGQSVTQYSGCLLSECCVLSYN